MAWAGSGRTVNISSGGVLFTTESPLLEGAEVELAISWPALLNNVTPIKLVVTGALTRSDRTQAAMHIEKYEFKTCCFKNGITKPFYFGGWERGAPRRPKGSLLSHK